MSAVAFCEKRVSTKRRVRESATDFGAMSDHLSDVRMTPLYPVSQTTTYLVDTELAAETKTCFWAGNPGEALPDIIEGDIIIMDGEEYSVYYVGEWPHPTIPSIEIIVRIPQQRVSP